MPWGALSAAHIILLTVVQLTPQTNLAKVLNVACQFWSLSVNVALSPELVANVKQVISVASQGTRVVLFII